MIKYTEWGKHIRWGNFCFLYAGLCNIAEKSGNSLELPDYFAWKYLENPPKINNNTEFEELFHFESKGEIRELLNKYIDYFSANRNKIINVNLGSHLQSELWFIDNLEYIKNKLIIKKEEIDKVREKYKYLFDKPAVGIGLRLGDFLGHGIFYQIPFEWYTDALINCFPNYKNYNIVVFSDDIEKAKSIFKGWNFKYAEPNNTHTHANNFKYYHKDPFEQFILASQMDNFIIGSSTFSWWNAWYVKNFNNGTIIHSGKNLSVAGEKQFGVNKNYYPTNWIEFPVKEKKWVNNNDGSFSYENM